MRLVHRKTYGPLPTSEFELVNDSGEVLGFAQIRHRPSRSHDLPPEAVNNLYYQIEGPYRGRGYGKALMGLALAEAERMGLGKLLIAVDDDNPASRHIIESHGAVWVAKFPREGGADTHLFEVTFVKQVSHETRSPHHPGPPTRV
jgi:predicted acetyltransferase